MSKAIVLGAGMIGRTMAMDLAASGDVEVTVVDARDEPLAAVRDAYGVRTARVDLSDPAAVTRTVAGHDVAVGALPSQIGLRALRAIIEAGVSCCDISFMPEDPRQLAALAVDRGVTAVVDCGVAPGLTNMIAGHGVASLDRAERMDIYVGGLPIERRWPFEYKASFSPHDVIEEYTRPARLVEHGQVVVREALSEPELIDFPGVGTLEAFNTDGLRSLIDTLDVPFMREKTMRYPGHIALMRVFRDTGLFSDQPVRVPAPRTPTGGEPPAQVAVSPRAVMGALLFPKWSFEDREADMLVMRVEVTGERGGAPTRLVWDLMDRYDPATDTRSMSRTTAFPATITARMMLDGTFPLGPGVHPPELPAREPGFFDAVVRELAARGVTVTAREMREVSPA